MRPIKLGVLILSVLLLVTAALPAAAAGPAAHAASPDARVRVRIVSFAFKPSAVTINVGDTVIWKNAATIQHTTTSDSGLWDSGPLNPGTRFKHTFTTAGTFTYHCAIHTFMTGSITVQ